MSDVRKRPASYVVGVLLGAAVGLAVAGPIWVASAENDSETQPSIGFHPADPDPSALVAFPPYPKNESGMTYGSGTNIDDKNPGPDLIGAIGADGTFGYIRAADRAVNEEPPANPEEAANWKSKGYSIPLYAADGTTVIGEFKIYAGQSGSETPPE